MDAPSMCVPSLSWWDLKPFSLLPTHLLNKRSYAPKQLWKDGQAYTQRMDFSFLPTYGFSQRSQEHLHLENGIVGNKNPTSHNSPVKLLFYQREKVAEKEEGIKQSRKEVGRNKIQSLKFKWKCDTPKLNKEYLLPIFVIK